MSQHYDEDMSDKKPKPQAIVKWEDFESELKNRERDIEALLPKHVTKARFISSAVAAVKQTPDLLQATPRSLFAAITKSAQDGLLPDGREGVITIYNTKVNGNWQKQAQWNPMTAGLRKRARELDGIIVDAQVVHENDTFVWHQGDDPRIEHVPAQLGTPRGQKIGAYAVFKREDGTILHREVMDITQIETVRAQSKAADSLMWTKFSEEGYRKTVIRRGIKTVPVSENLESIVRRDDDLFDWDDKAPALVPPSPPPAGEIVAVQAAPPPAPVVEETVIGIIGGDDDPVAEMLAGYIDAASSMDTLKKLDELDDEVCVELDREGREDLRAEWNTVYEARKKALK